MKIKNAWLMKKMALIMKEQNVNVYEIDKIFSSLWISKDELLFASKEYNIKILKIKGFNYNIEDFWCDQRNMGRGIHAIVHSKEMEIVAWGLDNHIHFKHLNSLYNWDIKVHADTIFSLIMLSHNIILSGSRDGSLCLTDLIQKKSSCFDLRIGSIRGLSKLADWNVVGALNSVNGLLDSWDFNQGSRIRYWDLPNKEELVCIESFSNCFAIGSQNHVTFVDHRCPNTCLSIPSYNNGAGVRSLLYKNEYLIVGSGSGTISFFDIRAKGFLEKENDGIHHMHSLHTGRGRCENISSYADNAVYTLCFNDDKSILFAGGGPIRVNSRGAYAGLWWI